MMDEAAGVRRSWRRFACGVDNSKHDDHSDRNRYERCDCADPAGVASRISHRFGRVKMASVAAACQARLFPGRVWCARDAYAPQTKFV